MSVPLPASTDDEVEATASKRLPVWVNDIGFTTLYSPKSDPAADVIFVHGLHGHPRKTWRYRGIDIVREPVSEDAYVKKGLGLFRKKRPKWEENRIKRSVYWPADLLPDDRNDIRIMTYGYDSHVTKFFKGAANQTSISGHGRLFLSSLAAERITCPCRPLIFVAHSLGGLVVKEALRRSRDERHQVHLQDIYQSTYATIFLGTPHRGSRDARWGEVLRRIASAAQFDTAKPILADLDPSSGNAKLDELAEAFSDMLDEQGFKVYSFQESQGKASIGFLNNLVVPKESSALNERKYEIKESINSNHMDMCRFKSRADDGYKKMLFALNLYVGQIKEKMTPAAKEELVSASEKTSDRRPDPIFMVPYTNNPHFVGREEILDQLKARLGDDQEHQKRVALWGLGGIGKSQIAIRYAYWYQKQHPERSVFWIHASNANRFHERFLQIAQELKIPGTDAGTIDPKKDVLSLVKDWLEREDSGRWLMIIDNADDAEMFFRPDKNDSQGSRYVSEPTTPTTLGQYIPDCHHGTILVTTRNKKAGIKLTRSQGMIQVVEMDELLSVDLVRKTLDVEDTQKDDIRDLVALLDYLPLALVQAAAYIQENSLSVRKYISMLSAGNRHVVKLLSENFEAFGRDSQIPNAVAATWMISFDHIRRIRPRAAGLLSLMAFLDRLSIPQDFLLDEDEDPLDDVFVKACADLKAFSLIVETPDGGNFNVHRLVQMITHKWLYDRGEVDLWAGKALQTVSSKYPSANDVKNWNVCANYLPHAQTILQQDSESGAEELLRLSLSSNVATYLWHQGRWTEAEKLGVDALEASKRVLGVEHPDTLTRMANLALTYSNQGRLAKAEKLGVDVLETSKRVLGVEHPDTLTRMANLALTYWNQGRWTEAEELGVDVLETSKRVLGVEHPDTLTRMANLASTYWNQGRWTEAEKLEVDVLETSKRVLGAEHPNTLTRMANLASTYLNQGRWTEAEELGVDVLETSKRVLGAEHPNTLTRMANLASTYWNQGRWTEAEELGVDVLETSKRVLGAEHPNTLTRMANLASTYRDQGRWTEAEKLEVDGLETSKRVLGVEHPNTLTKMANLALTYWDQGRWTEAEKLEVDVLETSKRVLGVEHPNTLTGMINLACTWKSQGRHEGAIDLLRKAERLRRNILGSDHYLATRTTQTLQEWEAWVEATGKPQEQGS